MSKWIKSIFHLFTTDFQIISTSESENKYEMKITSDALAIPTQEVLENVLSELNYRDQLTLQIKVGTSEAISLYTQDLRFDEFSKSLKGLYDDKEPDEKIELLVTIYKKREKSTISLYSLSAFESYLVGLAFNDLLLTFKNAFADGAYVIYQAIDQEQSLNTRTIHFGGNIPIISDLENLEKLKIKRRESIKVNCHYGNSADFNFIPDDFKLEARSKDHEALCKIFDRLAVIQCLISLADISNNTSDGIFYKINGYKAIGNELNFVSLPVSSLEGYFEIYSWIYEGGNLSDKIGLARNIITLHLVDDKSINLQGNPSTSIKSGFELYLKQNIKQYIEIRNKVSEQLIDFNKRANLIIDTFGSNFQKSIFAFLSFFTSVFVLRVLSKGDFIHILTPEATIVSLGFLAVAVIYLVFSHWEIKGQKERFSQSYTNMKDRYKDLLLKADIDKILNADADYNNDIAYISNKQKLYMRMWVWSLIAFTIMISVLFCIANTELVHSFLNINQHRCEH